MKQITLFSKRVVTSSTLFLKTALWLLVLATPLFSQTIEALYLQAFGRKIPTQNYPVEIQLSIEESAPQPFTVYHNPYTTRLLFEKKALLERLSRYSHQSQHALFETKALPDMLSVHFLNEAGYNVDVDMNKQIIRLFLPTRLIPVRKRSVLSQRYHYMASQALQHTPSFSHYSNFYGAFNTYHQTEEKGNVQQLSIESVSSLKHYGSFENEVFFSNEYRPAIHGFRYVYDNDTKQTTHFFGTLHDPQLPPKSVLPNLLGYSRLQLFSVYNQYYVTQYTDIQFSLNEKALVRIENNGRTVYQKRLQKGRYHITDIPLANGGNTIQAIQVTSVLKKEGKKVLAKRFLLSNNALLSKGSSELALASGVPIELGQHISLDLKKPSLGLSAYHRHGLRQQLNSELFFYHLNQQWGLGSGLDFFSRRYLFNTNLTVTAHDNHSFEAFHFRTQRINDQDKQHVLLPDTTDISILEKSFVEETSQIDHFFRLSATYLLFLSERFHLQYRHSQSTAFSSNYHDYRNSIDLNWFTRFLRYQISIDHTHPPLSDSRTHLRFSATLYQSGHRKELRLSEQNGVTETMLNYHYRNRKNQFFNTQYQHLSTNRKSLSIDAGTRRLRLGFQDQEDLNNHRRTFSQSYQGRRGSISNRLNINDANISEQYLRLNTAIVYADKHVAISDTIRNGFVLLYAPKSVPISFIEFDNDSRIDWLGPAVITSIPGYQPFSKSITGIKMDDYYPLNKQSFQFKLKKRHGIAISVAEDNLTSIRGTLLDADRKPMKTLYGTLHLKTEPNAAPIPFFTNRHGQFMLQSIAFGTYIVKLNSQPKKEFILPIKRQSRYDIDLGDIVVQ